MARFQSAISSYGKAIAIDPGEHNYYAHRASAWIRAGQFQNALLDLGQAIRLYPEEPTYYYERALAFLYACPPLRPEAALPDLETAIRLRPEADWYRMKRGYIRFCQGLWMDAANDFIAQNYQHQCRFAPYLGAFRTVWIQLSLRLHGHTTDVDGVDYFREYTNWYHAIADTRAADDEDGNALDPWPIPMAQFLAGDIDESTMLSRAMSDEHGEDDDTGMASERTSEAHFVLAFFSLSKGMTDEFISHLNLASGLHRSNPMRLCSECYFEIMK